MMMSSGLHGICPDASWLDTRADVQPDTIIPMVMIAKMCFFILGFPFFGLISYLIALRLITSNPILSSRYATGGSSFAFVDLPISQPLQSSPLEPE